MLSDESLGVTKRFSLLGIFILFLQNDFSERYMLRQLFQAKATISLYV